MFVGPRLSGLLRAAGLVDLNGEVHARLARPGEYRRGHLASLINSVRDKLLERRMFRATELASLVASLEKHLDNPDTVVVRQLLFQAWGRKPKS